MMYWDNGIGVGGMALMLLGALPFWGLIIAGIVALVRYRRYSGPDSDFQSVAPQRVLADSFARGEIDEEEYTHRLLVLDSSSLTARP